MTRSVASKHEASRQAASLCKQSSKQASKQAASKQAIQRSLRRRRGRLGTIAFGNNDFGQCNMAVLPPGPFYAVGCRFFQEGHERSRLANVPRALAGPC